MTDKSYYSSRVRTLTAVVGFLAVLNIILMFRIERPNTWVMEIPLSAGVWEPIDSPIANDFLAWLGGSVTRGVEWENPLSEKISSQFISVRSYQSFRKPEVFFTLGLTAKRQLPLFGPDRLVDAWVLKAPQGQGRLLVYSWLQSPSGKTYTLNDSEPNQGFLQRVKIGWLLFSASEPLCLVRLSCPIPSFDRNGLQTRRDMDLISKEIYESNRKSTQ